jgi:methionyl-tRNA formyltransferase
LRESAISIFFLTPGVDDGDVVWQEPFEIGEDEDATSLYGRLEALHARAVRNFCWLVRAGPLPRRPQDHTQATYWPRRRPADGVIDWAKNSADQLRWIRALTDPYPGAFTWLDGVKYLIWRARPASSRGRPGEILGPGTNDGVLVGTADGAIEILLAQREAEPRRPAGELLRDGLWSARQQFSGTPT